MKPYLIILMPIIALVSGCKHTPMDSVAANDPFYAPTVPVLTRTKIVEDGSLFTAATANGLFADAKARRVGDIITVRLSENTNATKSAGTTSTKESSLEMDPVIGLNNSPISIGGNTLGLGLGSSNEFTGDAQATQSNSLQGDITVTVVEVLPNNNLIIRGEKWLTLNNGDEYIRLTGIVRPDDVTPTNEIDSNKIANARIQYSGTGSFARSQEKGWLTHFFSSNWWPL